MIFYLFQNSCSALPPILKLFIIPKVTNENILSLSKVTFGDTQPCANGGLKDDSQGPMPWHNLVSRGSRDLVTQRGPSLRMGLALQNHLVPSSLLFPLPSTGSGHFNGPLFSGILTP